MALTVVKRKNLQGKNPINTNVVPTILKKNPNLKIVQSDKNTNIIVRTSSSNTKLVRSAPTKNTTTTITTSSQIVPMKRNNYFSPGFESTPKAAKLAGKQFSLQRIASTGTPLTTFDGKVLIQSSTGLKQQIVRASGGGGGQPIKIKAGTAVKIEPNQLPFIQSNGAITQSQLSNNTVRRPTIFIKGPTAPKKTIRSVTLELIEKNPYLHLGVSEDRLTILQNIICPTINLTRLDLYITLKKMRLNEEFAVLGEYFEYNEIDIQRIFIRSVLKLSKCMKYLVRWPESKKYYDRHKNLPIAFRSKLSYVQSLIECVETDVRSPLYPQTLEQLECKNFKYILTITPSGIISYVSDAYVGNNHDDLTIFNACNFRNVIPKYLSLVADPGKAIRKKTINTENEIINNDDGRVDSISKDEKLTSKLRTNSKRIGSGGSCNTTNQINNKQNVVLLSSGKLTNDSDSDSTTDSADEIDEDGNIKIIYNETSKKYRHRLNSVNNNKSSLNSTMNIVNSELTSLKVKDFSIPTVRVREPACRIQIRNLIYLLREYKILQSYSVLEPNIYQYINEILVICSALTNLQR